MIKCEMCMYSKSFIAPDGKKALYCGNRYGMTSIGVSTFLSLCGLNRELEGCFCGTLKEELRHKGGDGLQLSLFEK